MRSPFAFLDRPTDAPVLIDPIADRVWTQDELADVVSKTAETMATGRRELVFCLCERDIASVIGHLAAVRAGHPVAMLAATLPADLIDALIERYQPGFVIHHNDGQTPTITASGVAPPALAEDLTVLLSTSGTTGSPKFVRLSRGNIDSSSDSIATYLGLGSTERAIQSLPMHYSYGLSILHSHLAAGGTVIVSPHSVMRPEFWSDAERWEATSFAGVPYSYQIIERMGVLDKGLPESIMTLTQSGARLAPEKVVRLHGMMAERGGRMFVMYGQTESTARISYVPPEMLPEKAHCVGRAIPYGSMSLRVGDDETTEPEVEGELVFRGPMVSQGYTTERDGLALGDERQGVLYTGDLGKFDADGLFRLTGRTKRIAKVYGLRINLDEVESAAGEYGHVAVMDGGDDRIVIWRGGGGDMSTDEMRREIARHFNLNPRAFDVREVEELPLNPRGKVDYGMLARSAG